MYVCAKPARGRALLAFLAVLGTFCSSASAHGRSMLVNGTLRFQKPYNVCTSDWAPIVMCADIEDPADYSGYQIALWREIAQDLGWSDDDWTFTCVDWTAMIDDLIDPNGFCSFAPAGVEVSLPNIVAGLKFSWPIYKSGFQVLISSQVEEGGTWAFAEAFHWSVWVALGVTALFVSLAITTAELFTYGNRANRKGLRGWSWYSMGKMVQIPTHVGDPKTWASRVLVLGYAFLALIIVHLFTATTASKLTMQRLANDITGRADLPGKKVESWEPYVPLLRKYSIDADALPWDSDEDTATMLKNLRTRKHQALILDSPVVQYHAAQAAACDLYPVGDPFETFNLAIAFPPDIPNSLAQSISASIVRLQTSRGLMDQLENHYVKGDTTTNGNHSNSGFTCSNAFQDTSSGSHNGGVQIHMTQVAGLWYILLFTLTMALFMTAAAVVKQKMHLRGWPVQPDPQDPSQAGLPDSSVRPAGKHTTRLEVEGPGGDCVAEITAAAASAGGGGGGGTGLKNRKPAAGLASKGAGEEQQEQLRLAAELGSSSPGGAAAAGGQHGLPAVLANSFGQGNVTARRASEVVPQLLPQQQEEEQPDGSSVLIL